MEIVGTASVSMVLVVAVLPVSLLLPIVDLASLVIISSRLGEICCWCGIATERSLARSVLFHR